MNSIPASQLVNVIPGVLGAGGNPLSLNSVFVTDDSSVPIGAVYSFSTLQDVKDFFGSTSQEADMAAVYFGGFDGATRLPGTLHFAQFNESAVSAYLRSGSLESMTLAELQALSGTVVVTLDGEIVTSSNINLSAATSFSNAAAIIQTGMQTPGGIFSGTGEIGGAFTAAITANVLTISALVGWVDAGDSITSATLGTVVLGARLTGSPGGVGTFTQVHANFAGEAATASNTVLTISAVSSGSLHVGDTVVRGATTGVIASFDTGSGGIGRYFLTVAANGAAGAVTVAAGPVVTYSAQLHSFVITSPTTGVDSTITFATGTLADDIFLQAAQGAVLSQGADAGVEADTMDAIAAVTQNWGLFSTTYEPVLASKEAYADWVQTTEERYAYVAWDSDVTALTANASATFGAIVNAANDFGVIPVYDSTGLLAAFICGTAASIDFAQTNGRLTFAFKAQAGLTANVTDATEADNLIGNGYNFYGSYATANQQFSFLQNGQISGAWEWADAYVNQIYLNSQLQLAFMDLLANVNSIPYNNDGYAILRAAALDPINEGLNFGSIRPGVALSASQRAQVNTAAGINIADTLQNLGWYLQVTPADALTRAARGSPPMTLWYTDGGSVQRIELSSIDVQ